MDGRIIFGIVCIALALLLLAVQGLLRFRRWLLWRKRPDLRQRGGGEHYTGGSRHSDVHRPLPYSGLDNYKRGIRRRRSPQPTAYSGLGSYKRGRNRHSRSPIRSFWTPSYKGRKFRR